ncbi:DUF2273 domain-containing protein [Candidatus Enterococcus mansonii]|uniref:Small integral membrane protein n=1 Tax=Candidatus Enterococcus mansonii TaxID=1834181 RepID=A0A242CGP5_9ENTE|nr:DUF2273 domain-containing protein [Enterococcus sp. 4G2_DIV0659]OTO09386.1 hypothetical protein A5880_000065 [Enterococcus sp. 4G2_DIV0659]
MKKFMMLAPYKNQWFFTSLFFFVAILFMTIGFWKTMLILFMTGIGFFIGTMKDEKRSISSILASLQAFFER